MAEINCILERIMKVSSLNVLSYLTDTFNWSIKEFIKEFIKEKIIHWKELSKRNIQIFLFLNIFIHLNTIDIENIII